MECVTVLTNLASVGKRGQNFAKPIIIRLSFQLLIVIMNTSYQNMQ